MNYADPFGIQESTPLSRALRRIQLQSNQQLNWPTGYLGPDYIASINVVFAAQDGLSLSLPDALGASEGTGFLLVNRGEFSFTLLDFGDTTLTTLNPGEAKYMYCEQNTNSAGEWHSMTFGEGVSVADAVELAGSGLTVTDGKLSLGMAVSTTASNVIVSSIHRGRMIVNNGGSIDVNLPQYTEVGNNFFFCLHNGGSGTVNIKSASTNKIDDYDSLSLAPNESVIVFCSGTPKWYTVGYGRSTQFQFTKLVKDVSAGGSISLTSAEASNKLLQFTGSPVSNVTVIVPSVVGIYYVQNTYSGPYTLTLKTSNGSGLSLSATDRAIIYCDGVNVVSAQSVAVGVNLSVVDGSLNAPSIGFSSDPDTGLYKSDSDTVGFVSGGVEAARINGVKSSFASKFGIGTLDPQVMLHVASSIPEVLRLDASAPTINFVDVGTPMGNIKGQAKELRLTSTAVDGTASVYIGTTKRFEVTATGIKVNGSIVDGNNTSFATLNSNEFLGMQVITAQRGKLIDAGRSMSGIVNIDTSKGNSFSGIVVGPTTLNFIGKPAAGQDQTIYVKLKNGGTNVAYGTMCQFANGGLRPTLSSAGYDVLAVWYDVEQDCFVIGQAFKDYKA